MEKSYVLSMITTLRELFDVVRLVDAEGTEVWDFDQMGNIHPAGCCFAVWGKGCRCENCTSLKACAEKPVVDKYELFGDDAYHVTSRYIELDGRHYALEIVSKLSDRGDVTALAEAEQERQRIIANQYKMISVLSSEFTSVYYIDLKTDELTPYSMNENTESEFGKIFRSGIKYNDAYRMYVASRVLSEDRAMMLKAGTIGNIMKELRRKKTFNTVYRNTDGKYCEMKLVKVGNEPGNPEAVALGFAEKDEELRSKEEAARTLKRNLEIIGILASEYSSVYYIDLTTDELDTYTMNAATESEFGSIFRSGIKYSSAFRLYVDTLVCEDDKPKMLEAGSIYNILSELADKKTFITAYRNTEGKYCEMKFVKVGDAEYPEAVALGFSEFGDR